MFPPGVSPPRRRTPRVVPAFRKPSSSSSSSSSSKCLPTCPPSFSRSIADLDVDAVNPMNAMSSIKLKSRMPAAFSDNPQRVWTSILLPLFSRRRRRRSRCRRRQKRTTTARRNSSSRRESFGGGRDVSRLVGATEELLHRARFRCVFLP